MRIALVALLSLAAVACGTLLGVSGDDEPDGAQAMNDADAGSDARTASGENDGSAIGVGSGGADSAADASSEEPPPCIGGTCPRWVFVTYGEYSAPQVDGTSGADDKCQTEGNTFKPGRTWKALLSDGISSVSQRFTTTMNSDYVTGNNLVIAHGWSEFLSPSHAKPIRDSFNQPPSNGAVWTNTDTDGHAVGADCSGWKVGFGDGVHGDANATDGTWLDNGVLSCVSTAHLYCVEQ